MFIPLIHLHQVVNSITLKKDIITVSSLELLATTPFNTKYIIPMIDARRGYVYAGVYDNNLNSVLEDQYIKYDDLKDYFDNSTIVSFNELDNATKPIIDVVKVVEKHKNDKGVVSHLVNPNYLKKTEAEEHLEEKND